MHAAPECLIHLRRETNGIGGCRPILHPCYLANAPRPLQACNRSDFDNDLKICFSMKVGSSNNLVGSR
jgi:hypothetical protein